MVSFPFTQQQTVHLPIPRHMNEIWAWEQWLGNDLKMRMNKLKSIPFLLELKTISFVEALENLFHSRFNWFSVFLACVYL